MEKPSVEGGYRLCPEISISGWKGDAQSGYHALRGRLEKALAGREKTVLTVECYPGTDTRELWEGLKGLGFDKVIFSDDYALPAGKIDEAIRRELTDDPVFGIMTTWCLEDFFPKEGLARAREAASIGKRVLIYGVGASLITRGDILVQTDVTRWELQLRFRRGMNNWRTKKTGLSQREKYKRGYFAEWRWADRVKEERLGDMDLYLDMTVPGKPVAVSGDAYRDALEQVSRRPFRLTPYFDPGVWGGDWMKSHFSLPENGSNYAWSFDGVPEENSLTLDFSGVQLQTPARNLVLLHPRELLGDRVHGRYGKEFPIRFDMLDTVHGQNLSLQVHPLTEYIQQKFHMAYTQDESYYILDAPEEDACVYLGLKTGIEPDKMLADLENAQSGGPAFQAERYVNRIPVKKHDHLLIPAGTVHCSGAGTMVLEISATPYIFTFKLWDWGRLDLDGKPRPIHLEHGKNNIQWDRDTQWVNENLVNQITTIYNGELGTVECTGLHPREPLDTFRIRTAGAIPIRRQGSVHMMNLVEGRQARLVSREGRFPPFYLMYAETCIVPEAAGEYEIQSLDSQPVTVILACVRE